MDQKTVFLDSEADAWKSRNQILPMQDRDPVIAGLQTLQYRPHRALEVGCGTGWRLREIRSLWGAECWGIDPASPPNDGDGVVISRGTADVLPFDDSAFDLLIFGFCLYLTDPKDHFRIIAEADRVLRDGGMLVIFDFVPGRAYKNAYAHRPGLFSHKMDYANLLLAHPSYRLLHRSYAEHSPPPSFQLDEATAADFLLKDAGSAFPSTTIR